MDNELYLQYLQTRGYGQITEKHSSISFNSQAEYEAWKAEHPFAHDFPDIFFGEIPHASA